MKAKTKLTKLLSIPLALVMVVGMLPTVALAEEPDAFLQFADAPGEFFYRNDGGYDSEGPTVDTTFTLTEPTMITGIWTYHYNAEYYDIDFSKQTIQLKDTATDTVVYSGAVRIGHYYNTIDCDWVVLPNIVLPAGTYQVIDSHHESWCAKNGTGVTMVKGYSGAPSSTALFSTSPIGALALLNNAKTGTEDSTWDSDTNTLTLNGVNFETTAATAVILPADSTIILNGVNTIKGGNSNSDSCYGIYALGKLTIQGSGTLNVTGGATTGYYSSYGIYASRDLTIKSGTVIATGGTVSQDYNNGIFVRSGYVTIESGTVIATGGTAGENSCGINSDYVNIKGGKVEATGGTAGVHSYGIYLYENITIEGGTVIAKANTEVMNKAPSTLPAIYWWRSSDSGQYKKGSFNWGDVSTYVEIVNTEPITTYTVTFDANGGTGSMADVIGVSGEYTLPANGFTSPEGKRFKAWSVNGTEKAVGDKITVTANITVTAVWENIPAGHTCDIKPVAKVSPTCTEDGNIEYYTCSGCGKLFADATGNVEITADKIVDKATGHQYAWVIDKEATETETGIKHEECVCGAKRNENTVIPVKADNTEKEVKTNNSKKSPATGSGYETLALLAIILASGSGVVAVSYGRKKKEQAE